MPTAQGMSANGAMGADGSRSCTKRFYSNWGNGQSRESFSATVKKEGLVSVQYDTPCVRYLAPTKHPFPSSSQGMFVFSQKVPPIFGVHFQTAGGCGGAAAPPPAYVLSIPGLFVFAALVSPCLPVRVPRVLCCVGAISARSHVRCTKSHGKKRL